MKVPSGAGALTLRRRGVLVAGALVSAALAAAVVERARPENGPAEGGPPLASWLALTAAGALLAAAAGPAARLRPALVARVPWSRALLALVLLAATFEAASLILFARLVSAPGPEAPSALVNTGAWLTWVAATGCTLAAFVAARPRGGARQAAGERGWPQPPRRSVELGLVAGLLAAALALRLVDLGAIPPGFWFDEADFTLAARELTAPGAAHMPYLTGSHNHGALYFWALDAVLETLGTHVWTVRLLPALTGAATVPLVYLLGARLYGWRVGLAAAVLLAGSTWHLTFSRIGMDNVAAVALDVGALLCAVLGLRTGRLAWFAGAGILLGLSLQTYIASSAFTAALLGMAVVLAATRSADLRRTLLPGATALVVATAVAATPVAVFALSRGEEYQARSQTVSIFNERPPGGVARAIASSAGRHALMFHWSGDRNGRHNRSGTPMLDPLTAVLFLAGIVACLLRARRWQYALPVVWLLPVLALGVLTLSFEAPQGARTLEGSVVAALVAAIFVGEAARAAARGRRRHAVQGLLAAVVAVGAVLGALEYFDRQTRDRVSAVDMQAAEQWVARTLGEQGAARDVWVPPVWSGLPHAHVFAPSVRASKWAGPVSLPWRQGGRDQILLLPPDYAAAADAARDLLPGARLDVLPAPRPEDPPLAYRIAIAAARLRELYGVRVSTGGREVTETQVRWPRSNRPRRLTATLVVREATATAFLWRAQGVRVRLDGQRVTEGAHKAIALGLHSLDVRVPAGARAGELLWAVGASPPAPLGADSLVHPGRVSPRGLLGEIRRGTGFESEPVLKRVDPVIAFYMHETPLPRPYTVEWSGRLYAPQAGRYVLATEQIDATELAIDGRVVIRNARHNALMERPVELSAGWHDLRLRWLDRSAYSHVNLMWAPPDRPLSIIPSRFLRPHGVGEGGPAPRLDQSDPAGRLAAG